MISDRDLFDLQVLFVSQNDLLSKMTSRLNEMEMSFKSNDETAYNIIKTQQLLSELMGEKDLLSNEELSIVDQLDENVFDIYNKRRSVINDNLVKLQYDNWDSFVQKCLIYNTSNGIDGFTPYEIFLKNDDYKIFNSESYQNLYKWDKLDYLFVGLAGFVGALVDVFIVAIPRDLSSGEYKDQKGSPLTKWLQSLELPDWVQKWLEDIAKVPYDRTGGADHRIDTVGHDPILGFVFGVIDIIRGTSTKIKDGTISIEKVCDGKGLLEALIIQFLHLLSDISTKRGLPVPFASIFRLLDFGTFKRANGKTATISQLTLWMYHNGYDLRHFVTMATTPASIEIILRMYIMIKNYSEGAESKFSLACNPKYRSMMLSAHSIACAANVGKIYLRNGNPLAINYAEWMALIRYLMPSIKYWVFDRDNFILIHMESISDNEWNNLVLNGSLILNKIYNENLIPFELGMAD